MVTNCDKSCEKYYDTNISLVLEQHDSHFHSFTHTHTICRVTNCSPHLNRNRKWAQHAQYNKFVREWVKELG